MTECDHSEIEDSVAPNAPDGHGHPVAGVHVALGLGTVRRIRHDERMLWSSRQSRCRRESFPRPHGRNRLLGSRGVLESDGHADGVSVLHRNTVRVRTYLEPGARHFSVGVSAKKLEHFAFKLRLFVRDVWDDVSK